MFYFKQSEDDSGHVRNYKFAKDEFWREYFKRVNHLLKLANTHYVETKALHDAQLKERMASHQNTEIICECGGNYSLRNKQKHFKTQRHIKYCQSLDNK